MVRVVRLNSDGNLDRNFGKDGVFDYDLDFKMPNQEPYFESSTKAGYNVDILSNGFIAITGEASLVPFIFFLTKNGQKIELKKHFEDTNTHLFFQRVSDNYARRFIPFFVEYQPLEFALLLPCESFANGDRSESGAYLGSLNKQEYLLNPWEKINRTYDSLDQSIYCLESSPQQLIKLSDGRIIASEWGSSVVHAYAPLR
jgi:hypothetical protein